MRSDYTEVKVIDDGKEENPLFDQRLNNASGDPKLYSLHHLDKSRQIKTIPLRLS